MPKARFYADENIEARLIQHLRSQGVKIDSAVELGFQSRDDSFHLHEACRRKSVLPTRDVDFLDDREFPYYVLRDTAVIVLRTDLGTRVTLDFGYVLVGLLDYIAPSGRKNLAGLKVAIKGPRIIFRARVDGKVKRDEVDISKPLAERALFQGPE
ncbi:MAG TPA: DUF5615 family PIN-like protein [Candidatus Tectomicrobia bacterium]|nr:DUF5615 family PIN-like protein [Candidatus Tectomicrobia bacterium]